MEQDLVISRALVSIFSAPGLARSLAFRGGTALYKLHLRPASRYSEDIDLVQLEAQPAGSMMTALRATLDPWLGTPQWKQTQGRVTFVYRFESGDTPPVRLRLKVEINSREHFAVFGTVGVPFQIESRWFRGTATITTYCLEELLATKLRALYQRRKGRDLFDLSAALKSGQADPEQIIAAFGQYMASSGQRVTRAEFDQNLQRKLTDPQFTADIGPLLAGGGSWDILDAAAMVTKELIDRLPGAPRIATSGKRSPGRRGDAGS